MLSLDVIAIVDVCYYWIALFLFNPGGATVGGVMKSDPKDGSGHMALISLNFVYLHGRWHTLLLSSVSSACGSKT